MLSLHSRRGGERVLDVGCERGVLVAGAARQLDRMDGAGRGTGIDIWSRDMGGNSEAATRRNLEIEHACARSGKFAAF